VNLVAGIVGVIAIFLADLYEPGGQPVDLAAQDLAQNQRESVRWCASRD